MPRHRAVHLRVGLALVLAACSGGDEPRESATPGETAAPTDDSAPSDDSAHTDPPDSTRETGRDSDSGETAPAPEDADGDGHVSVATGGDDCDDLDPRTYPGAAELCDYADRDCDGDAYAPGVCAAPPAPKDVAWAVWEGLADSGGSSFFGEDVTILGDLDRDGDREPLVNCEGCDSLCGPEWAHGGAYLLDNPGHVQMPKPYDEVLLAGWVGDCTFQQQGTVTNPGDIDGDGYDDLAFTGIEAYYSIGWLAIKYGPWDASWPTRGAIDETIDAWWWMGSGSDSNWGHRVTGPGDLDGDGGAELVVSLGGGTDGDRPIDGGLYRFPGADWRGQAEEQADDFRAVTGTSTNEYHTSVVGLEAVGDVNGDGTPDLLVARDVPTAGEDNFVTLVDGAALAPGAAEFEDVALAEWQINNGSSYECNAGLGDTDGDGYADLAVGEGYVDNPSGRAKGNRGGIYVVGGRGGGWTSAALPDVAEGLWLDTDGAWLNRILDCAGGGDFDGDLAPDLVLGGRRQEDYGADRTSPNTSTEAYLFVVPGRDGPPVGTIDFASVALPIASTHVDEDAEVHSRLGVSVALGDLTGDGLDDALVGDDHVNGYVGAVYVFPGWEVPWDEIRSGR